VSGLNAGDIIFAPGDAVPILLATSGDYEPTGGFRGLLAYIIGGGGAGGGTGNGAAQAEGGYGGGGELAIAYWRADQLDGSPISYTIGAGGTPAAAGANQGGSGGTTIFNGVTALGGQGGFGLGALTGGASIAAGGQGGSGGTGGFMRLAGEAGSHGRVISNLALLQGKGGASGGGFGQGAQAKTAGGNGNPGRGYGGGGGGAFAAATNFAGGAGGQGAVILLPIY
jgi:hypothetical protein